jgi:rhodanese-related sulfurtransferase
MTAEDLVLSGAVMIDVREEEEWSAGHAPHALLIPMSRVEARLGEIRAEKPAVIVCRTGGRSKAITQLLTSHGINAVNLAGGMCAWQQAGLPVVTEAGAPGHII